MKEFKGCKNYTLLSTEELKDINAVAYVLKHDKTNARVALVSCDDDNKAFMIGFKTPMNSSTGVQHICEHSVLCGSKNFPVKDAMTEVSKGSLNTFMNAFTYPDRTIYPVASVNDKDFKNLVHVYMDAVFNPNVSVEDKIFKQEGWHYELNNAKDELTINGVVYNEMKGVYSSPDEVLSAYTIFSLFPETQYSYESGGDPEVIPSLSYTEFINFYKKMYHPSNSRIFLYGDCDFEEQLKFIDEEYLSKYEALDVNAEVAMQAPFEKPVRVEKEYSISDDESTDDATFLTYNVVVSDYKDKLTTEAMNVIDYALCSVPGAILKERLTKAGIGKEIHSVLITDMAQKCFSIVAQNANPADEARFVEIIEDTLKDVIKNGFDKKTLEAAVTSSEFSYREADFGYLPKGIAYGMFTYEAWNYSDDDIFNDLCQNKIFKELREGIDNGYFEKVLKKCVLDNNHKSVLVMKPKKGLQKKKEDELKKKLSLIKDAMKDSEIKKIVKETKDLKKYQDTPDSKKALETIPTLSLSDIKKEARKIDFKDKTLGGVREVYIDMYTNEIAYMKLSFLADKLPEEDIPYFTLLKTFLGFINTKNYKYGDLINVMNIKTGGMSFVSGITKDSFDTDKFVPSLDIHVKAFYPNIKDAVSLVEEVLFTSDWSDKKRLKDILCETKTRIEGYLMSSGHSVSISRAFSYFSASGAFNEKLSGIDFYHYINELIENFDERCDKLIEGMKRVLEHLLWRENFVIAVGADEKGRLEFEKEIVPFIVKLNSGLELNENYKPVPLKKNEAFTSASQVQFVTMCGNFKKKNFDYSGTLQVVRNILSTDYLWNEVRLKGGAYGSFCAFGRNGDSFFTSYRDPKLKNSLSVYRNAVDYIAKYKQPSKAIERFIITTIGDLDAPLTPSTTFAKACGMAFTGLTNEDLQKERDEILSTDAESIRKASMVIKAIVDENALCVVGGESKINSEGDDFDRIVPLIKK